MTFLAFEPWQYLLNGLGWCLAEIYSVVPNYALAIIILTLIIRLLLLPFGFKQIKSMQHMQALQPELKALQKKYKNNKQKLQEEQMQLYREAGVNPLGGCLPLLLTLPFLFAMYAVIRPPVLAPNATDPVPITAASVASGNTAAFTLSQPSSLSNGDTVVVTGMTPGDYNGEWTVSSASGSSFQADIGAAPPSATAFGTAGPRDSYVLLNNHLPTSSTLFYNVVTHQNLDVLSINLQCSLATSGTTVQLEDVHKQPIQQGSPILNSTYQPIASNPTSQSALDCGTKKFPSAIPYVLLLGVMLASAIFMQRQMSKANPQAAQAGPQAALMKYMPLIYVVWGWAFPAGLILYWTTANGIQIAQQTVMLRAGHIGPDALERAKAEQLRRQQEGAPKKKGFMSWMSEKAQAAQQQQGDVPKQRPNPNQDGKGGQRKTQSQARKPQSQKCNQQQAKKKQQTPPAQDKQPPPKRQPKTPPAQDEQPPKGESPEDGSTNGEANGEPNKPVKGAKPGNQLRPKKKR